LAVYGGFYNGKNDHAALWATLQRLQPQWKGLEYTDSLFNSVTEVFLVYSSLEIVNSPALRKMILAEFNLPLGATKFEADYHFGNLRRKNRYATRKFCDPKSQIPPEAGS
jgi:hypothetical protein